MTAKPACVKGNQRPRKNVSYRVPLGKPCSVGAHGATDVAAIGETVAITRPMAASMMGRETLSTLSGDKTIAPGAIRRALQNMTAKDSTWSIRSVG